MQPRIPHHVLRRLAVEGDVDPRTIQAAIAARQGKRPPPRGRAGERAAEVLERHPELLNGGEEPQRG
jgi:hypothetical protein